MKLFPAIDLADGQAVRLTQGDFDRMTVYDPDPVAVAGRFWATGARQLHLVDLYGARDGKGTAAAVIRAICGSYPFFLETGGGIRDEAAFTRALEAGARRVILGTAAFDDPAFLDRMVARYGDAVAVGVDAAGGFVAVRGWQQTTGLAAADFCRELARRGVATVIYTDIARDGMLSGIDPGLYRQLAAIQGLSVIASGGVAGMADLEALAGTGVGGAIIGKALYTGRIDLAAAVRRFEPGEGADR